MAGWWDAGQVYPEAIADLPHHHQREPPKLGEKAICGQLWITLFSDCVEHDRHQMFRKSFVAHCYWIHPMIVWSVTRKDEQHIEEKSTRPSSIVSLEPSFLRPSGLLIHAQHLRTEWTLCIHYNMRCTIRETTSLGNLFQPLFLRQNGLAMMAI